MRTLLFLLVIVAAVPGLEAQTRGQSEPCKIYTPGTEVDLRVFDRVMYPQLAGKSSIVVSRQGFVWVGTINGIFRFDGYETKPYLEEAGSSTEKSGNIVLVLLEDHTGTLWAGTWAGVKRLVPGSATFQAFRHDPGDPSSLPGGAVISLCEDLDGAIWMGTSGGRIARFDHPSSTFREYTLPRRDRARRPGFPVQSIVLDSSGGLRVNAVTEIFRYDRDRESFDPDRAVNTGLRKLKCDTVSSMTVDRNGRLWFGTGGGVVQMDAGGTHVERFEHRHGDSTSLPLGHIGQVETDAFGDVWLSFLRLGVFRLEAGSGRVSRVTHGDAGGTALFQGRISGPICADPRPPNGRATTVWCCDQEGALSRIVVRKNPVREIRTHERGILPGISSNVLLWSITRDHLRRLWIGTYGGQLISLDPGRTAATVFRNDASGDPRGLGQPPILQIYEDPSYTLWIVGEGRLHRYDEADRSVFHVPLTARPSRILRTRDGQHWMACYDTTKPQIFLSRWDPRSMELDPCPRTEADTLHLRDGGALTMHEDRDGMIWFGTFAGGLYKFDPVARTYRRFLSSQGDEAALKSSSITWIMEDAGGTMWVSTSSGLYRRRKGTDDFQYVRMPWQDQEQQNADQSHVFVRRMCIDGEGGLWLTIGSGYLARFDPRKESFRLFSNSDGVRLGVSVCALYDATEDLVYVGGRTLLAFHPDSMQGENRPPPVQLTRFRLFEKDARFPRDISVLDTVTLSYRDNYFSVSLSALDFTNPALNQYAYRLEGFDRDWIRAGVRRYLSYTNLDPGTYVLRVRGSSSSSVWNTAGRALTIVITPPWWKTPWAYAGFTLLCAGTLASLWYYDRRRVALRHALHVKDLEAAKLHEVDQMKSRFFANISHEFRTPLTLLLGPIDKWRERVSTPDLKEDLEMMRRNGGTLLQLINQLLDLSKIDAGRMVMQVRPLDLVWLLRPLVLAFSSLAERRKIVLVFDPEEDSIIAYVDREKIERVVTNLLSNAFKFTDEGGEVHVSARMVRQDQNGGGLAEISVRDTGMGMAPEQLGRIFDRFYQVDTSHTRERGGSGIGLSLARELVELHHGTIRVESELGKGSMFTVGIPLGRSHWTPEDIVTDEPIGEAPSSAPPVEAELLSPGDRGDTQGDEEAAVKPVVLVVEDNADVRRYLRGYLDREYRVEEAGDGVAGLERARTVMPDLVLSDIMMPGMDGVSMCRTLKSDDRTNHIPVVLLTARAAEETKLEGLELGADDYILKPFDARELLARVKNLIELRKTLREKYRQQVILRPGEVSVAPADQRFLARLNAVIESHLSEPDYSTEELAGELCMSRMQLNRKLQALTGHPTHELLREFRLERAAELLTKNAGNISEVAYEVGFSSPSHFARVFRERFGKAPSDYTTSQ